MTYKYFYKPLFDKLLAFFALILLFPVLLFLAISIFFLTKENPVFVQERTGKCKCIFKLYKFRTMKDEKIIKFGGFLRKFGLDELPQLINILKGEMSLVGPRPLLTEYDSHYSAFQNQRFVVKSGITGLAQIKGRNTTSWEKRFEYDVFYSQNVSFLLDLKIIFQTIILIFQAKENPISAKFNEIQQD